MLIWSNTTIAVIAVAPMGKASFVYSYVRTRLMGQHNGKWPICLVCVKTADNCDKSYWKLSFDTQIQFPFTITKSQPSSIKLPTVNYGSGSSRNRELRQRQGKRHLKINICQVVTILRLPQLVRVPQCWRSSLKLDWYTRRKVSGPLRNSALETSATQPVRLSKSKTQRLSS